MNDLNGLPKNLDLNDWIENCLHSDDELLRQTALEELSVIGIPPYLQQRIREIEGTDSSETCKSLAKWVSSIDRAKSELRPRLRKLDLNPESLKILLDNSEPAMAIALMQSLRKSPSEETLELWRNRLLEEKNTKLIQVGLTLLAKFGKKEDANLAPLFLANSDVEVICAAMSLLQQQDTDKFIGNIKHGLVSKSFKVQLHAVHLLKNINATEAIKYIVAFLKSKNPIIRQKSLRELMLMPFDSVANLFLQFLSIETNSLLLVKAGFVIAFNPKPDFPLKIFDIYFLANGVKKHILQLILKQNVEAVHSAGILDIPVEEYMSQLKSKLNSRRSEMIIQLALKDLDSNNSDIRLAAVERLTNFIEREDIRAALQARLDIELDAEIRQTIERLISVSKEEAVEDSEVSLKKEWIYEAAEFLSMKPKAQKAYIRSITDPDDFRENRLMLHEVIKEKLNRGVLLFLLKKISELGTRLEVKVLKKLLDVADPAIVAATIRAIAKCEMDQILPVLNQLLIHDDPRVKTAALEVYVMADKEGAVQYLESMLNSTNVSTRRLGLAFLPQLDYSSAESLLWNLLKYEANGDLRMQAFYMIAANPTEDGIISLYQHVHNKDGVLKEPYNEIWDAALLSVKSVFGKDREELEQLCIEGLARREKEAEAGEEYSYDNLVGQDKPKMLASDKVPETLIEQIQANIIEFKSFYIAGSIPLAILLLSMFIGGEGQISNSEYRKRVNRASKTKFLSTKPDAGPNTQVGGSDWQGTLKSGARKILGGTAYINALKTSVKECEEIRKRYEQDTREYYLKLANDSKVAPETRQIAEARLNPSFAKGTSAWESENFTEAELYFEKAVKDPSLNGVGKCFAFQKLAEIAEKQGNKTKWIQRMDQFFKELKNMPGYENVEAFSDFAGIYGKMKLVGGEAANNPAVRQAVLDNLKQKGYSDQEANKSLDALKNMDKLFNKNFKKH